MSSNDRWSGEQIYKLSVDLGQGSGFSQSNSVKHFSLAASLMQDDESLLTAFIGLHNYYGVTKHDNNYAYVLTNKRIIIAQQKVIGNHVYYVHLDTLNDIHFKRGMVFTTITFDTLKETFNVAVNNVDGPVIAENLQSILYDIKKPEENTVVKVKTESNPYEEVKQLKELFDLGIINEEEYELKRRELLGL